MAERALHRSELSDLVRVFRRYVLSWTVEKEQDACDVDLRNTRRESAIFLCSADLLVVVHTSIKVLHHVLI